MGRDAMHPVELTEEWTDATGAAAPTVPGARRRWTRGRGCALAVAATLVVGLASTPVVLDARERARPAHLPQVPGVLHP